MNSFHYCLNSSTIRPASLLEKIRIASAAGYRAIELWNDDLNTHVQAGGSLREIKQALDDAGLQVPTVIAVHGWLGSSGQAHQRALDEARQRMEQGHVGRQVIAFRREMRVTQAGRPALQIFGQLGGQDQRRVTGGNGHISPRSRRSL